MSTLLTQTSQTTEVKSNAKIGDLKADKEFK